MAITQRTRKILWARSGNECAFANCTQVLVVHGEDGANIVIGEEAHIVAQRTDGPRGDGAPLGGDVDGVANLMLVCPTHHRIIDEQPHIFGVKALLEIKRYHEDRIAQVREKARPASKLHPSTSGKRYSALPIFQSWECNDTIIVVSLLGDEPTEVGRQSWRVNGFVFELIRGGTVIFFGVYSEAESDVLLTVDGSLILITEQIFDFKAGRDTPFIQLVIDAGQTDLHVRTIRLYTPPIVPSQTSEEIMARYECWLADGVDPAVAVTNLRDYGFANPVEVQSVIRKLFESRSLDGEVAECATKVSNEVQAFANAGN